MVIGYDASRAFIKDRTGTENYSYQLLLALSKIDKKNHYIVYLRPGTKMEEKWSGNFKFQAISWPRLWTQVGLAKQTFEDNLDVLFIPAHTIPLVYKPGLKTVVTVHDLGSEYLPSMHQIKQRLYLGFMQKYQLESATKLIAVSKATKEDLIKRIGIEPKKIEVVYEGFNYKLFKHVKSDTKFNSLKSYFLFVGTVQPRKNLARLIEAFARYCGLLGVLPRHSPSFVQHFSQVRVSKIGAPRAVSPLATPNLLIVGGKGWLSDDIYKLPKLLGIENKVKFLGHVPDEDLPALYSGAEALLFPSLFEGFGLPILEAQACGCPVLTSNVSSMPEVAGRGAIFVNPYDIDDIVDGMRKIEDGRLRVKIVKAGLENIKRFSWEKAAKETLEVLENV